MSPINHIGCRACGQRIRERHPDVCLKKLDGSEMHFFHVRCAHEPERIVAEDRKRWSMTYRQVFEDTIDEEAA